MSDVKHQVRINLVGKLSKDAEVERVQTKKGEKPLTKFSVWASSGKNRKTDKWQTPFFYGIKVWGDSYGQMKKGDDVNLVGVLTRYEYEKDGQLKQVDTVEVTTDERGEPNIVWAGDSHAQTGKHVDDEAVAKGRGAVIQRKAKPESLEIGDSDIPF